MNNNAASVVKSSLGSKFLASCCVIAAACPAPSEDGPDPADGTSTGPAITGDPASTSGESSAMSADDASEGPPSTSGSLDLEFVAACGGTGFVVVAEPGVDCGNWPGAEVVMKGNTKWPTMCRIHGDGIEAIAGHLGQIQTWIEDCPVIAPAGVPSACSDEVYALLEDELATAAGVPTDGGEAPLVRPIVFVVDAVGDDVVGGGPLVIDEPSDVTAWFPEPDETTWHAAQVCRTIGVGLVGASAELRFIEMLSLDDEGQLTGTISSWLSAMQAIIDQMETVEPGRPIVVNLAHAWYRDDADAVAQEAMDRVQAASKENTIFVAAAGNDDTCRDQNGPGRPAAFARDRKDTVGVSTTDLGRHPGPLTQPGGFFSTPSPGLAVVSRGDACYASVASSWATGVQTGMVTHMKALKPLSATELVGIMYTQGSCVIALDGQPVMADASQLDQLVPRVAHQTDVCRSLNAVDGGNRSCGASSPLCVAVPQSMSMPLAAAGSEAVPRVEEPSPWPGIVMELPGLDPFKPLSPEATPDPTGVGPVMKSVAQFDEQTAGLSPMNTYRRQSWGRVGEGTNARNIELKAVVRGKNGLPIYNPGMCAQAGSKLTTPEFDGPLPPERPLECGDILSPIHSAPRSIANCPSCCAQENDESVDVHVGADPTEAQSLMAHEPRCVLEVERDEGRFQATLEWDEIVGGKWYRLPSSGFQRATLQCFGDRPWAVSIPIVPAGLAAQLAGEAPPEALYYCDP